MDSPIIRNIMQSKSLNMEQKMVSFMLHCPPEQVPFNNKYDFSELGDTIKQLINGGKLTIHGLNQDGSLNFTSNI